MDKDYENLKKRLIIKRKNVREKLQQLKRGEMLKESIFNPVTKHLKNIESTLQGPEAKRRKLKEEKEEEEEEEAEEEFPLLKEEGEEVFKGNPFTIETRLEVPKPKKHLLSNTHRRTLSDSAFRSNIKQTLIDQVNAEDYNVSDDENPEGSSGRLNSRERFKKIAEASFIDYLDQYDPLPRKYVREMYEDVDNKESVQQYGVRLDPMAEKFKIGDSFLTIDGPDVYVQGKRYKGSIGLYELLFKKYPKSALFTDEDQRMYRAIVYKTNAHRRNFNPNSQIVGSRLEKYKKIIAPAVARSGLTIGLMEVTNNKKDRLWFRLLLDESPF